MDLPILVRLKIYDIYKSLLDSSTCDFKDIIGFKTIENMPRLLNLDDDSIKLVWRISLDTFNKKVFNAVNLRELKLFSKSYSLKNITKLQKLVHLDLKVDEAFNVDILWELPSLETVILKSSTPRHIGELTSAVSRMTNLKKFDVENIKGIDSITLVPNLEVLNIRGKDMKLPKELSKMKKLRKLRFNGVLLELPTELERLVNLRKLNLNGTFISDISAIGNLVALEHLDLGNIKVIKKLPDSFKNLRALKKLRISKTGISDISVIARAPIEKLDISDTLIEQVPKTLRKLKEFRGNRRMDNSVIEYFTELVTLYLDHPKNIPSYFKKLTKLKYLHMYYAEATHIDNLMGLNLETLIMSGSQLTRLPNYMNLPQIKRLDISFSQNLLNIENVGQLPTLTNLNVANSIHQVALPDTFRELINLQKLNISQNSINTLPLFITTFQRLELLNASFNRINVIPDEFLQLTNLKHLDVMGNSIRQASPEIRARFRIQIDPLFLRQQLVHAIQPQQGQQPPQAPIGITEDLQNVHNSNIQKSVNKAIEYLMNRTPTNPIIDIDKYISKLDYDLKYDLTLNSRSPVKHSVHGITFKQAMIAVLNRINELTPEQQKDALDRLKTEMTEGKGMCFTGKLNRLVNSLVGFDDNISLNISENDQAAEIMRSIGKKLHREGRYTINEHKRLTIEELESRHVDNVLIDALVDNIEYFDPES